MTKRKRRGPAALVRVQRKRACKPAQIIAYDFETTRIARGTPRPLYLTAFGLDPEFHFDGPIKDLEHLGELLRSRFLLPELMGVKFVAWNANAFDAYFIAAALLHRDDFILRPYLTKGNSLRGLKVIPKGQENAEKAQGWEFLDGMAMLGLAGTPLAKLLKTFAPDYSKLTGVVNFEAEEFNPASPDHRAYAMRDSEGLYHAMTRAQSILVDNFNQGLTVTMGNACIKIFQAHIPQGVRVDNLPGDLLEVVRSYVMRGGFCFCNARYEGPVWKYDLNQAYAAAMREAPLPSGRAMHTSHGLHRWARVYVARVSAEHPSNRVPFYYRTLTGHRIESVFTLNRIEDTWLTSIEVQQLKAEGWRIEVHESWCWEGSFNMRAYVDKLETIRTTCEGGPSGPIGTVIKAVGNHSYGKTVEQLENTELLIAQDCPEGYAAYYADGFEPLPHVWWRFSEPRAKAYHQPHIGAFITAHVRMVVRRAALLSPKTWLYADTDCVVFSEDVTSRLDIDAKRYGAWKLEEDGTPHLIIAKKVYYNLSAGQGHAKGLNVKRLTGEDYRAWFEGAPPTQEQVQRNNFVAVMQGSEMYRLQTRRGTSISAP